jgi:hypothetical protein
MLETASGALALQRLRWFSAKAERNHEDECCDRHARTEFSEQFAVPRVKRQGAIGGDIDVVHQSAFAKRFVIRVTQHLGDPPELIDEAGDPGISGSHHGAPDFDAPEKRIGQMLMRTGGA